ncbi:hypothetical protein XF_0013 [Xylella fastidiosa 9a5c]|uniref:Uncharacterized protein n=1 Tax=Xylella fastidiosa (strain 9a5c) TaxID=160492 RepID=Q9PHD1_XYLFA|nr:hypothetical protein XF_0013 [Xylella fastidiosa 9a5c]
MAFSFNVLDKAPLLPNEYSLRIGYIDRNVNSARLLNLFVDGLNTQYAPVWM